MLKIDQNLNPVALTPAIERLFELSGNKIDSLRSSWDPDSGAPVFTVEGQWRSRGWTEWTQGFQLGSELYQFEATGEVRFLERALADIRTRMAVHVSHVGVHDHGFNNVSTYGNLLRLWHLGRLSADHGGSPGDRLFYELALKASGAVQAARWTALPGDLGYIHSFNGPHSLFADTLRSLRSLALAHCLGHVLCGEHDQRISLLDRLVQHAETTARWNVYFGAGRDIYDIRGRVAHESVFNVTDGAWRCPSSQQGYSPFSTWTRGLAWVLLGFAELAEFVDSLDPGEFETVRAGDLRGKSGVLARFVETARATADFYLEYTPTDGIPYWDTGAPGLAALGDYLDRPADPFNPHEPVDSSAAAITAQGLIRLGNFLEARGEKEDGARYFQAGLSVAARLMEPPYLSTDEAHQGLLLHSVYHRPNGWDHCPGPDRVPRGESSQWGDYHLRELALLVCSLAGGRYLKFFPDWS